ncbi:alpha-1,2-fucosyltransferase [Zunongwangia atlantica]|uniref:Glycosyl transferase family 11 n=1 Tax=Zunongwangia atlantica 22II14-10F7 TaxID=1185767 RepID=A0A1Y1SYA8_9FLAO|nr:alpha-1,2-fucosyltransferase [Zunongwangia atlantica]ORL43739.1 hypothetical protein IIF7_19299 [Zunongwangia atlantica 22II14-10F7]
MKYKIVNASGQTCNKFWIWTHYIADAIECKHKVIILNPDMTFNDYPGLMNNKYLKFPLFIKYYVNFFGYKNYIRAIDKLITNRFTSRLLFLLKYLKIDYEKPYSGSYFSIHKEKHNKQIKEMFEPSKEIIRSCKAEFSKHKSDYYIGVHIRRGDYKTFKNGKYYYSIEDYNNILKRLLKQFAGNLKVSVFISSNEEIDLSKFEDINCFLLPNGSVTKDLYGLSMCDYIIGPPSTFSSWASYIGDKKIFFIRDLEKDVKINEFKDSLTIWQ